MIDFCREWIDARHALPFETDGVVIKLDDIARREKAGSTSKFPRWAFAYKFPAQQATTKLKAILVNVGRTGAVTPYADLEPVFLAGSTISKATLHNAQEVARKDIREGDYVLIEKAGDVIPEGRDVAAAAAADRRRRAAALGDADDLPDLRHDAGARRRGSGLALREHELSGPAAPQPRALRLAAGDEHRRLRRVAGRLGGDATGSSRIPPTSTT